MASESSPQNECPACGHSEFEHWDDVDSWICTSCSFVFEATENDTDLDLEPDANVEDTSQSGRESWEKDLSVKDKSEANLVEVLSRIEELGEELPLEEKEVTRAGEFATEAWKTSFMHGRTKETTIGASVYASTREGDRTIPPGVIADALGTDKRKLKRTYRQLKSEQDLDLDPPEPSEYVEYLCSALGLSEEIEGRVEEELAGHTSVGGNPIGTAAAGLCEVTRDESDSVSLREAASTTTLTKETIWRHTQKL